MKIRRIRHKLLASLILVLCLGFTAMAYLHNRSVEASILKEYQRTLHRLSDSVVMSVETIMSEGHAEILPGYAKRLKSVPGILDFRIARVDGTEAYLDNRTIDAVNDLIGEMLFEPRNTEKRSDPVFLPTDPQIAELLAGEEAVARIESTAQGRVVEFFDTIPGNKKCDRCHGAGQRIRGIVKIRSSMSEVEGDLASARLTSLIILAMSVLLTVGATSYVLGRIVAVPIEKVSEAIKKISSGDFNSEVSSQSKDEVGKMVGSFNTMRAYLRETYESMEIERAILGTVIQGAQEAVVVTNAAGQVVLVNAAACEMLGKSESQIRSEGIVNIVDRPDQIRRMLDVPDGHPEPELIAYRERWLRGAASTIRDGEGKPIGSAALFRDVTQEQGLLLELQRLSTTDALTDVYNRRHLDATLALEMDRAQQTGKGLAVIMFDVDHFKKFNDTYGHDQGDRVLKMAGQVMKAAVREYDVPCRYGGEEFAIVLPATDCTGAMAVAERLRCDMESMRVDGMQVTISIGVACYPQISASSPESLMLAVDEAMYRSKQNGRNQTTLAEPASGATA